MDIFDANGLPAGKIKKDLDGDYRISNANGLPAGKIKKNLDGDYRISDANGLPAGKIVKDSLGHYRIYDANGLPAGEINQDIDYDELFDSDFWNRSHEPGMISTFIGQALGTVIGNLLFRTFPPKYSPIDEAVFQKGGNGDNEIAVTCKATENMKITEIRSYPSKTESVKYDSGRKYSNTVNKDLYEYIVFEAFLERPVGVKGKMDVLCDIYQKNRLLRKNVIRIDCFPEYSVIMVPVHSGLKRGKYRVVMQIGNSEALSYDFIITSSKLFG